MNYVCNRPLFHLSVALKKKKKNPAKYVRLLSQRPRAINSIEHRVAAESKKPCLSVYDLCLYPPLLIYEPGPSSEYIVVE